jgi:hypothetical protein
MRSRRNSGKAQAELEGKGIGVPLGVGAELLQWFARARGNGAAGPRRSRSCCAVEQGGGGTRVRWRP